MAALADDPRPNAASGPGATEDDVERRIAREAATPAAAACAPMGAAFMDARVRRAAASAALAAEDPAAGDRRATAPPAEAVEALDGTEARGA